MQANLYYHNLIYKNSWGSSSKSKTIRDLLNCKLKTKLKTGHVL